MAESSLDSTAFPHTLRQAEDALRESEAQFRAVFECALDAILIIDDNRRFVDANPAACAVLGLPREQLLGRAVEDFVEEAYRPELARLWEEFLAKGETRGEYCLHRPGDTPVDLDFTSKADFLPGRHLTVLHDITERKRAEEALRESNERFRLLVENVRDYAIFMLDASGNVISWNAGAERIKGYPAEEILGKHFSFFYPPEDAALGKPARALEQTAAQGRLQTEGWRVRKDGSRFWADVVITALRDEAGNLRGFAKITRDVSERERALLALRESDQRFHSILDSSPSIIFIKDPAGRYVYANPQFQKLLPPGTSSVVGKTDLEIFPAPQAEAFRAHDRQVLESGNSMEFEEVAHQEDGLHTSIVNKFPLRDTKGETYGLCGIVTDISAHKRAEATIQSLLEISTRLNSTLDVELLMEILVTGAIKLAEAEGGCAGLRSQRGMTCQKFYTADGAVTQEYTWPPGQGVPGWLVHHKAPYLTNDARNDPHFVAEVRERFGIRSALSVPILDARGELLGFFQIHNKKNSRGFTASDQEQLMAVSQIASVAIQNALAYRHLEELKDKLAEEKLHLERELHTEYSFQNLVGESRILKDIQKQLETVAPTDATVLIQGETGTGKELIARAIHNLSPRREQNFVRFNCAAVPAGLLESELFGYEKGAFTGALSQKIGRLEIAHRGTLFLDEVGDIPLELQPKLLRALQEKEFERLGSARTIPVDVRLVAATNRDLGKLVSDRQFRSDLYYRLNVFPIFIPPLRARAEDIPLLARYFVEKSAQRMGKHIHTVPAKTLDALSRWSWPGNVRELENFIERAVILTQGTSLQAPLAELKPLAGADKAESGSLKEAEREHILQALRECKGVIGGPNGAAARLGLKRTTLNSKMRKLKISRKYL